MTAQHTLASVTATRRAADLACAPRLPAAPPTSRRWLFSSATSHKAWLHDSDPAKVPVSIERQRLLEDLQRDEAQRQRLAQLWEAMRGPAEAYARSFICKRLH